MRWRPAIVGLSLLATSPASAQDVDELSKKLANPVASMISVPIQGNFEFGGGPHRNAFDSITNIQPVIPAPLNDEWNVIIRTVLPVMERERYGARDGMGLGDITQSFFFTPRHTGSFVWGIGPPSCGQRALMTVSVQANGALVQQHCF